MYDYTLYREVIPETLIKKLYNFVVMIIFSLFYNIILLLIFLSSDTLIKL